MNPEVLRSILVGAGLVTGLAAFAILLLRRPFLQLLVELCGSQSHGRFWLAYACLAVVLTALFGALLSVPTADPAWREQGVSLRFAFPMLRSGLFCLLLALAAVALALLASISQRRNDRGEPTPALRANAGA